MTVDEILQTVRSRVLRGLRMDTLHGGDRLPSAREYAAEFNVEHRLVLSALRLLADEGLVELRPRGGLYVSARAADERGNPAIQEPWLVELLTQSLTRDVSPAELQELVRRATETLRLRAVVIADTEDQGFGLCRELEHDFGFDSHSLLPEEVRDVTPVPLVVRQADLLVTTATHVEWLQSLGASQQIEVAVITVRTDLATREFALLLRQPAYAVVASRRFGEMLRGFFAGVEGIENLHILVQGEDDLSSIPADAPVYVTQRVQRVPTERITGRILPPARTISNESARALFTYVVGQNVAAMRRRRMV